MIFLALAAGAVVGTVPVLAKGIRRLRAFTDVAAGRVRGEVKVPIRLELLLNREQFERLMGDPEIELAQIELVGLKRGGAIPVCPTCGGACA